MKVLQIYRKPNPSFFSIEKVFTILAPYFEREVQLKAVYMPSFTSGLLSVFKNIAFGRRLRQFDVCHVTGDVHYMVLAYQASKTILTIHDCVFLYNYKGLRKAVLKFLLLDLPVRHARVITTISAFTKADIVRYTGCRPDKVVVIPNPAGDRITFAPKPFNEQCPTILFVGTTANKNLERTVEALTGQKCRLCILGFPSAEQLNLLNEAGIDFFLQQSLSEAALNQLYADIDIVLFPSLFEGFGMPVLEAQSAGRILITSNIEPMKSIAGDGAYLVDPYSARSIRLAIAAVRANRQLRDSLIQKGFVNLSAFSRELVAQQYLQLYHSLNTNNT